MFALVAAATGFTEELFDAKILPHKINRRLNADGDSFLNPVSKPCNVKENDSGRLVALTQACGIRYVTPTTIDQHSTRAGGQQGGQGGGREEAGRRKDTDRPTDRLINRLIDGRTNKPTDRPTDQTTTGPTDRQPAADRGRGCAMS